MAQSLLAAVTVVARVLWTMLGLTLIYFTFALLFGR
ncbi:hypothetical protein H4W29_000274 [Rhizobium viscosum]|uniref:Uncharacterized protein n=1 Tax=Rhizobium viscosum TaxID=1673 RepID=A0ABR9IIU4_RHIVS|nr:hypothetical protein [Rhizobium viscosum]